MGDIRKNIKSKAEAAAICCCCLLRYQADNTLRSLTEVGTAQLALPLKITQNAKVLALRKRLRKSGYREGRKASATAQLLTTAQDRSK